MHTPSSTLFLFPHFSLSLSLMHTRTRHTHTHHSHNNPLCTASNAVRIAVALQHPELGVPNTTIPPFVRSKRYDGCKLSCHDGSEEVGPLAMAVYPESCAGVRYAIQTLATLAPWPRERWVLRSVRTSTVVSSLIAQVNHFDLENSREQRHFYKYVSIFKCP